MSGYQEQMRGSPRPPRNLSSKFRPVDTQKYRRYFKRGRVFKMLWVEPTVATSEDSDKNRLSGWSEFVFAKVRWFLVVRAWKTHCTAVPIHTYGGQGLDKFGGRAPDHAPIIVNKDAPLGPFSEMATARQPLTLIIEDEEVVLEPSSYVDFSKTYTIEYNVKVMTVGRIATEDLKLADKYFASSFFRQQEDNVFRGHTGSVNNAIFSPDSRLIASVSEDNSVRIWDREEKATLQVLNGHTAPVNSLQFSQDGAHLLTASNDHTVRLWDVTTLGSDDSSSEVDFEDQTEVPTDQDDLIDIHNSVGYDSTPVATKVPASRPQWKTVKLKTETESIIPFDEYQLPPKILASEEDSLYKVQPSENFQPGEVFEMLWSEPINEPISGPQPKTIITMPGGQFYIAPRWFIVVANHGGHSICVPVKIYGGLGCAKRGVDPSTHGAIYPFDSGSRPLRGQLPGEPRLGFRPVRIHLEDAKTLAPSCRVNYASLVTVTHNFKVIFVGAVQKDDFEKVVSHAVDECWANSAFKTR